VKYHLTVKGSMGRINTYHYGCHFPTIAGHSAVSPTRPPWLQQRSATLHRGDHTVAPYPKDEVADLQRTYTITTSLTGDNSQPYTCKNPPTLSLLHSLEITHNLIHVKTPATPCGYKRGGRAPIKDTTTHAQTTDSTPHLSSEHHSVYSSKSRPGT